MQVITSIVFNLRRFQALASLRTLPLIKDLLSPSEDASVFSLPRDLSEIVDIGYNESQQRVIKEAVSMICDRETMSEKIYMIQTPPGSGKSHTIVGIIRSLAQQWKYAIQRKKLRILVCSPSNISCNKLMQKLLIAADGLNIVRLGQEECLSQPKESMAGGIHLGNTAAQIIDATIGDIFTARDHSRRRRPMSEEADIVLCTLNCVGNSCFDPYKLENPNESPWFDCLIVDEACQCLEIDIFILLRLGIRRVLLIGDPAQLPSTIISVHAKNAGFRQSLMGRLYSLFKSTDLIRMLTIQYCIAEEICRFPSIHFYGGRLMTDEKTRRERSRFPLKPYVFINVTDPTAELHPTSHSYLNSVQMNCIIRLINFLIRDNQLELDSIGVIIPYKQQVKLIEQRLGTIIDMDTVNGFQGRVKAIILLSTVRTHDEKSDRRRLNVSLTRGKDAVYIIGHAPSLKTSRHWSQLLEDAERRHCVFDYSSRRPTFHFLHKNQ